MSIHSLQLTHFRNIESMQISPCFQGLNIICGSNGSGKTSILEAIYYLGLGRSFRCSSTGKLIQHEADSFSVFAKISSKYNHILPIGTERLRNGQSRIRLAEQDSPTLTELAQHLPMRLINSQTHQLFESGPTYRRKYLDWGLFYHNEQFVSTWRAYERALKQRNAILRDRQSKQGLSAWTEELVKYGLLLDKSRQSYIAQIEPIIKDVLAKLLDIGQLNIEYQPGWKSDLGFSEALQSAYHEECLAGHTLFGPHRADLDVKIDGVLAKHLLSRGQQKLLICAMILAQGILFSKSVNSGIIYLIDDLPSELDLESRRKLVRLLTEQPSQSFITAIESDSIIDLIENNAVQREVFHVEHGKLDQMGSMAAEIA